MVSSAPQNIIVVAIVSVSLPCSALFVAAVVVVPLNAALVLPFPLAENRHFWRYRYGECPFRQRGNPQ